VSTFDDRLMELALAEARRCLDWGDVPVGAVVARGEEVLEGCTMYVTLEPCAMCAGALVLARVDRLVFGAPDPKAGFAGSVGDLVREPRLNHRLEVQGGVRVEEAGALLREFFGARRTGGDLRQGEG
jgi:tRNA(adenine34) deaminase